MKKNVTTVDCIYIGWGWTLDKTSLTYCNTRIKSKNYIIITRHHKILEKHLTTNKKETNVPSHWLCIIISDPDYSFLDKLYYIIYLTSRDGWVSRHSRKKTKKQRIIKIIVNVPRQTSHWLCIGWMATIQTGAQPLDPRQPRVGCLNGL